MKKYIVYFLVFSVLLIVGVTLGKIFFNTQKAPLLTYSLINGQTITSKSLEYKNYIIEFWSTQCETCIKSLPNWLSLSQKEHFILIQVAMSYDKKSYVENFIKTHSMSPYVVWDLNENIAQAFGQVELTPTLFLINKKGEIIKKYMGKEDFNKIQKDMDFLN